MADAQAEKQNRKKKAPKSQMQFSQGFALVLFWHELLRGKLLLPFPLQAGPVPAPGLRHSPGSRCLVGGINLQRVPGDPRHPMAPAAPASTERVLATTGAEGPPEGAEAQRGWWRWGLTPSPPRTVPSICWVKKKKDFAVWRTALALASIGMTAKPPTRRQSRGTAEISPATAGGSTRCSPPQPHQQ